MEKQIIQTYQIFVNDTPHILHFDEIKQKTINNNLKKKYEQTSVTETINFYLHNER